MHAPCLLLARSEASTLQVEKNYYHTRDTGAVDPDRSRLADDCYFIAVFFFPFVRHRLSKMPALKKLAIAWKARLPRIKNI
jgi:hypothetical protein